MERVGFLTMGAERHTDAERSSEEGQSVVEFLLILPVLIGFTITLVKLNTAIQMAIVNQQYARGQTLFMAYNSAWYPRISQRQRLIKYFTNQLIVGVSENSSENPSGGSGSEVSPKASVQLIGRNKRLGGSNAPQEEPNLRSQVRIRDTVTLCTPTFFVKTSNGNQEILPLQPNGMTAAGPSRLGEQTVFNTICGSPLKYE